MGLKCINVSTLRPRQNGRYFPDDIFKCFSWMKMCEFRFIYYWSLFMRVQLIIFQHLFRKWLGTDQARSHYLNNDGPFSDPYMRHSASMSLWQPCDKIAALGHPLPDIRCPGAGKVDRVVYNISWISVSMFRFPVGWLVNFPWRDLLGKRKKNSFVNR